MNAFLPNLFEIQMDKINLDTSTTNNSIFSQLSSSKNYLHSLTNNDEQTRVGEIFLTKNNLLYFVCSYCNENFSNVTFYVEHLYKKHLTNPAEEKFQEEPLNLSVLTPLSKHEIKHKRKTKNVKLEAKIEKEEIQIKSEESSSTTVASTTKNSDSISLSLIKNEIDDSDDERYDDIVDKDFDAPSGYFRCKVCKNNYTCNYKRRHRATHFEEKPFKCEFCGRHFARNDCLQLHTRIHVGEKPYKCEFCPKAFLTKGQKTSHEVIHRRSGERNFQCEMCNKKFLRKKGLIEHRERHFHKGDIIKDPATNSTSFIEKEGKSGRLKLYKCFNCEETFSSYNKKKLHEREIHGITKARSIEMIKNYFLG